MKHRALNRAATFLFTTAASLGPLHAIIFVPDGSQIAFLAPAVAPDDCDADFQSGAGGGMLLAGAGGNLIFDTSRTIYNDYGQGLLTLEGQLSQAATASSHVNCAVNAKDGSVLLASNAGLYLQGGGTYEAGCTVDADGGVIYFNGGTLTGPDFSHASAALTNVTDTVDC